MADRVGEFSVVYNRFRGVFEVLFNLTDGGQSGIVMRESEYPWGPFDPKMPLVDCLEMDRNITNPDTNPEGLIEPTGGCYGGYTHSALLDGSSQDRVKVHFNVSLWSPYKTVMMEADLTKTQEP